MIECQWWVSPIIDSNLLLDVAYDNTGCHVSQSCDWICFDKPQEGGLTLKPNINIYRKQPNGESFVDASYEVYSIRKVRYQELFWKINQRIAKLLSEVGGKGNNSRAGPRLIFLVIVWKIIQLSEKYRDIMSFKVKYREGHKSKNSCLTSLHRIQSSSRILQERDNKAQQMSSSRDKIRLKNINWNSND